MQSLMRLLIFTDLDATLLDHHTYSYGEAMPALTKIREHGIPLVIVSSKTRAEIEPMKELRSLSKVFVVENGSAVFLDRDFAPPPGIQAELKCGYRVIVLGRRYREIIDALHTARSLWSLCNATVTGFFDMTIEEIAGFTGLDPDSAARAKEREFSEPFIFKGSKSDLILLRETLKERSITVIEGGKLYHAQGSADKGIAARRVMEIYRYAYPEISWKSVALGDGPNDAELLRSADVAVVIREPDGSLMDYTPSPSQQVITPASPGPAGWNEAVLHIIPQNAHAG